MMRTSRNVMQSGTSCTEPDERPGHGLTLLTAEVDREPGPRLVVAGTPSAGVGGGKIRRVSQVSGNELGMFLRVRREALTPAEVGLPTGPRRRAPGLRRSEVAALAGVSVEYLTRLEQGRDRRPSTQVLSALADALRLTAGHRVYLYHLIKAADGDFRCQGSRTSAHPVRAIVRTLLDQLEPAAAVLLNPRTDLLAWTVGYERLMRPLGLLDRTPPNFAQFVFTDDRARAAFPDWERVADESVATLKRGPFRADPSLAMLADELAFGTGEAFTRRVETVPGIRTANGILRLTHPVAGQLRLAYEMLELSADDAQTLVVYLPADEPTAEALDRVNRARPGTLRVVSV
jgi:transcriptional regulator with XRE-family HTH domain